MFGSRSAPASPSKRWPPSNPEAPPSNRSAGGGNQNNNNSISAAFRAALADPRQCHRCRGWGHVRADCPTRLNSNRGRGEGQAPPPSRDPETGQPAERQYYNPDPLLRLIGEANEADIILEGRVVRALIDSGAQVSTITDHFARELRLGVRECGDFTQFRGDRGRGGSLFRGMWRPI